MKEQNYSRIYRFRNLIAIEFEDSPTMYLTPLQAQKISEHLSEAVDDILKNKFQDSKFKSVKIDPLGCEVPHE